MNRFTILALMIVLVAFGSAVFSGDITDKGMYQKDLYTFLSNVVTVVNELKSDFNSSRSALNAQMFGSVAAASDTAKLKFNQAATPVFQIGGVVYTSASTTVTLAGGAQTTQTNRFYLISVNSANTATCTAGTAVAAGSTPAMHAPPAGYCPVAGIYITASGTFTPGTSSPWDGVHGPTTIVNLSSVDAGSAVAASDLSLTGL